MSILSVGLGKQHRKLHKQKSKRKPVQPQRVLRWHETLHPNQILTLREWAALNNISLRTALRILASGSGPIVTQLSPHRVGVSIANNAKWQASRARG